MSTTHQDPVPGGAGTPAAVPSPAAQQGPETPSLLDTARSQCAVCETPFLEPIPVEQVREQWGDAADDEIGYACASCDEAER